jgi:hypothetical protein
MHNDSKCAFMYSKQDFILYLILSFYLTFDSYKSLK